MKPLRNYDQPMSDFLKVDLHREQRRRAAWKEYFGPAYRNVPTQLETRENEKGITKEVEKCVPQAEPGFIRLMCGRPVLPVIKYPKKDETRASKNRKLQRQFEERYGNAPYVNISNMYENIDPVVRENIYEGYWRSEEGRYKYLNLRKLVVPEKKYRTPVTTTMVYGWKTERKMRPYQQTSNFGISKFHKGRVIGDTFYRCTGVMNPTPESAGLSMPM